MEKLPTGIFRVIKMKVAILQMEGTNCEEESFNSFVEMRSDVEYLHISLLKKRSIDDYDILFIPGGFSAGDYVRAGAIFANRLKGLIWKELKRFVDDGKIIIGICNGFQVLIELGLLPGVDGISDKPEASLMVNDSNKFECRWTYLRRERKTIFTKSVKNIITLPVAHAEGKFFASPDIIEKIEENGQVVFRYVSPDGKKARYPWNPNGSINDIAGIVNPEGNVLGMMPHPERAFYWYQMPNWTRKRKRHGDGYYIFKSIMDYIMEKNK